MGVSVAGTLVLVAVLVAAAPPTRITRYTSSPKNCPPAVDMRQFPRAVPAVAGAVIATEISVSAFAATLCGSVNVVPFMAFPPVNANLKPASHAQEPVFFTFHVFVNACPGVMDVLSGMLMSATNDIA